MYRILLIAARYSATFVGVKELIKGENFIPKNGERERERERERKKESESERERKRASEREREIEREGGGGSRDPITLIKIGDMWFVVVLEPALYSIIQFEQQTR